MDPPGTRENGDVYAVCGARGRVSSLELRAAARRRTSQSPRTWRHLRSWQRPGRRGLLIWTRVRPHTAGPRRQSRTWRQLRSCQRPTVAMLSLGQRRGARERGDSCPAGSAKGARCGPQKAALRWLSNRRQVRSWQRPWTAIPALGQREAALRWNSQEITTWRRASPREPEGSSFFPRKASLRWKSNDFMNPAQLATPKEREVSIRPA